MSSECLVRGTSPAPSTSSSSSSESALTLTKKLSLRIGGESLHIYDDHVDRSLTRSCCGGGIRSSTATPLVIPLYNVLWVDVAESSLTLRYAASGNSVKAASLTCAYDIPTRTAVDEWAAALVRAAYGESQPRKRFKVLVNPFGGQGTAAKIFETQCRPILEAAQCTLDVQTTEHSGHAIDIAMNLDISAFDAVVCCSGDGLPHEVFNGLAMRPDTVHALKTVAVCQLPGGSGNAMCWNLAGTGDAATAALAIVKSIRKPLDLVSITQGSKRFLSFLSQSFGIIADVDLGTEDLRWMGGARFTYGLLQRIWKQTVYPCDLAVRVAIHDKGAIRDHYRQGGLSDENKDGEGSSVKEGLPPLRFGTVSEDLPEDWALIHHPHIGNFYAGNMAWMSAGANFFPASLPNDGMFDLVCVDATVGRLQALKTLAAVEKGGHFELPHVSYRKVLGYRIIPHKRKGVKEEYISIDGERIPFEPFQAEVHSGLGRVLAKGHQYEAPGV